MHHDPDSRRTPSVGPRSWRRLLHVLGRVRIPSSRPDTEALRSPRVAGSRVDLVVDPDGGVLLFRLVGETTLLTVKELDARTASLDARHSVHLDLIDATISSRRVVHELECLADRLERTMVRVRMVGVDPNHPAVDPRP